MTVSIEGPIRGLLGRWLMRFEAAGQIISMMFSGTTAVSTLSGVLAYSGFQRYVPYVLAAGAVLMFVFAYVYTELGVFNRKNREKHERGRNFARPDMRIDNEMIGAVNFAALHGRPPNEEEMEAIRETLDDRYKVLRNGVSVDR